MSTIQPAAFERFRRGFARYAAEHGMDAALERLTEVAAWPEHMNAHARARQQRVAFDHRHASRMAYTRAKNKIIVAFALAAPRTTAPAARPPVAARARRERPRARRRVASRDGPSEIDAPHPPSRHHPGWRS